MQPLKNLLKMRNLLQLEESVLSSNEVLQNGFKIEETNQFQNEIFTSGVSKFTNSVKMSKIVKKSFEFFKSQECKAILADEGISWTTEEFFLKMYGWKKSYGYKMLKIAEVRPQTINKFVRDMTQLREQGETPSISVENCLKTIRERQNGGQETPPPAPAPVVVLSLKWNVNGVNQALKVRENGTFTTPMEIADIENIIGNLQEVLEQMSVNS